MNFQSRNKKLDSVLSSLTVEELCRFSRIYAMTNEAFALALIEELNNISEEKNLVFH